MPKIKYTHTHTHTLNGINSRLDTAEEKIRQLDDTVVNPIQNEREEKDWKQKRTEYQ